ncbi:MAG: serine/threonine protein kinase [Anaerohalosphaeraceae bacterium]|nr:serine/threonine protein kinase [Anaerohalosphaeraceae bacterium]
MAIEKFNIDGFTIIRKLGTGARSTIYLATDDVSGQMVALKSSIYEKPEDLRIFEQIKTEYKVAKIIDHPYLRKCHKLIKVRKFLKVRQILMSMEMFHGQTLEKTKTLSLGDVMLVFRMVATGLDAMHQAGYIHCDIKPNNILINDSGDVRVIDLGQGCKIGTVKPRIQGTPDYIAPEQVRREHLDQRTDIFNLGATMYWAITGKKVPTLIPQANDLSSLTGQKDCPAPNEIHKKIPFGVSKLVMDCVKESPQERPNSMPEVISRLDLLVHSIFGKRLGGEQ